MSSISSDSDLEPAESELVESESVVSESMVSESMVSSVVPESVVSEKSQQAELGGPSDDLYKLPGFGLPLDFVPRNDYRELFASALDESNLTSGRADLPLTTLREFAMLEFMNKKTDEHDWYKKVFNKTIRSKWKAEALSGKMTEKMFNWCLSELQYKAGIFEKTGAVVVYNGDVVKSDTAIPESLRSSLKAAVARLENISEREKIWHPGSNGMVLDLVHPSLYPLVYGRTLILPDSLVGLDDCIERSGEGITVKPKAPTAKRGYTPFSERFQWLPCEVDISGGQGNVEIKSYINNLHPVTHRPLYLIIAEIISRTIPMWNMTLTYLRNSVNRFRRISYHGTQYYLDTSSLAGIAFWRHQDDPDFEPEWLREISVLELPEPEPFSSAVFEKRSSPYPPVDIWKDFADGGLQIIVKLFNVQLTPEKPEFRGTYSWHVEGQLNEHICASAIYYYDSNNVITSELGFIQRSDDEQGREVQCEEGDFIWLEKVFGCRQDEPLVQYAGTIDTLEGRLITWPNILERDVRQIKLKDHTRPGHQKILALFLVDPRIRIISTANVPCQQHKWWSDAIRQGSNPISLLPVELQDEILDDDTGFPIKMEEAKKLRLDLMEERKAFVRLQQNGFQKFY